MKGDAAGEGLRTLAQQVRGGAPQYQEATRQWPAVGQHAEHRKEVRAPLDLIQHDESAALRQREHRIRESREVLGILEIEGRCGTPMCRGDLAGECRLAHLPRAQQRHHRRLAQQAAYLPQCKQPVEIFHTLKSQR